MSNVMTTRDNFKTVDITHKPRRSQSANLRAVRSEEGVVEVDNLTNVYVPTHVTIEKAIEFYESNADGDFKHLYAQTAKWLRESMSRNVPVNQEEDGENISETLERMSQGTEE